jgi:hypothetical protein
VIATRLSLSTIRALDKSAFQLAPTLTWEPWAAIELALLGAAWRAGLPPAPIKEDSS